jgi:hypothetical protein
MPNQPEDTKPESWQRFFAAAANNRAWQLAEDYSGEAGAAELLNAAHAAAFHWQAVGTELHNMRAKMLLAQAHALVGHGRCALACAQEVRAYFLAKSDTPDWELAFVHTIHAHAAAAAGESQQHAESYAAAVRAMKVIADAEDRDIVAKTFRQVPAP